MCTHVYVCRWEFRLDGGVGPGLLKGTKGVIRGLGLGKSEFKGITLKWEDWQKSLVDWANENMGRGKMWVCRYRGEI